MEEKIHLEDQYLAKIFENIQDGIIIMDEQRKIVMMNPSAKRLTGWKVNGFVPFCSFCENRKTKPGENKCYLIENDEEPYFLSKMPTYHGVKIDVEMSTALMYTDVNSNRKEYLLVLRDQTLQMRVEEARFSKLMIQKLIEAKESEHKRLAQELHDGVGQSLYSISVALQAVQSYIDNAKLNTHIEEVRKELDKVMDDIKAYSHQLRPHSIDQLGIVPTLETLFASFQHMHPGLKIIFESKFKKRCEATVEINLYRVVQEALHNIAKYANASDVVIKMYENENTKSLSMEICDNGVGFNYENINNVGLGLKHMEERIDQLGGTIDIHSIPGLGTNIRVQIPEWKEGSLHD